MPLYSYTKVKPKGDRKIANMISYSSIIIGAIFLFWSFYPIISFEIYSALFIKKNIAMPVKNRQPATTIFERNSVLGTRSIFSTNLSDYTKAGLWFPSVVQEKNNDIKIAEYTLSIPRLNIANAKVIVGGEDLKKGLIHYAPKCLPGQICNVAIFGHSTLSQLAKPGLDYPSIFTYLPSMDRGDKIQVNLENQNYEYEVIDISVVKPDQISVLDQPLDDSYLTLVTCVPPGTVNYRLAVKASLVRNRLL